MRRAAKSRTSVRASAAHKDEDVQVNEVAAGVAGVAAAAVVFGAPDAAMADAYTAYLEAMKAQNIEPASVALPAEAPVAKAIPAGAKKAAGKKCCASGRCSKCSKRRKK